MHGLSFGFLTFTHPSSSFFELEPEAHDLFHFDVERQRAHKHVHEFKAKMMVEMIDFAVGAIGFLGPDLELLHDDLVTEGRKHHKNGIVTRHLYSMEHAVVYMLEEMLGDDFRREDRRAWELIFQMIIKAMVEGMRQAEAEEDAKK